MATRDTTVNRPEPAQPLRYAVALVGAAAPTLFFWGTYRSYTPWFPVPPIPWAHLAAAFALCVALTVAFALLFVRLGNARNDAVVAAVIPVWFLMLFSRAITGLARVTFHALTFWWLTAIFAVLFAGLLALLWKALQRGNGALITAAVAVFGLTTIAQHAHALLPPPQGPVAEGSFTVTEPSGVWVLVVDELASPRFLATYAATESHPIVTALEQAGFQVPEDPISPYSQTYPSLTSMLSLEPVLPGTHGAQSWAAKSSVFGGDHLLARSFFAAGRDVALVEPPISPAFCGAPITECKPARLDDFDNFLITNSVLSLAVPSSARVWPTQGLAQMDLLDELAQNPEPGRLVLAHIMLAHAPYMLDSQCREAYPHEFTSEKYLDQVACLTNRLTSLMDAIPREDVVLIVSDHGITRAEPYPMDTPEAREERLTSFVALRGCNAPEEFLGSNINAYRALVNCVTDASLEPVHPPATLTCYSGKDTIDLFEIPPDSDQRDLTCPTA